LLPWIKEGEIILISAWRGTGKTQFGLALASAIANGENFGSWKSGESIPALYLDGEMVPDDIKERIDS
jgi:RecA-family ATPase